MMETNERVGVTFQNEWDLNKKAGTWFCTHQSKAEFYCLVHIMFGYALVPVILNKMLI